jgi:hypothetical protein
MKRAQFFKNLFVPGIACGCAMALRPEAVFGYAIQDKPVSSNPNETPCDEKMKFTQTWVKRFFDIMDENVDEVTRTKLMLCNGAACAKGAYGEMTSQPAASIEEIDKTIATFQQRVGKENIFRNGNTVFFNYVGNPKGLKLADGYCLCPMIENAPATLSPTYCQCSVGYVQYMFQRFITFKPVKAELLESVRTGGKTCRFKVLI